MSREGQNISYLVHRIKYNFINHYIEIGYSPDKILEELIGVKFCEPDTRVTRIEKFIKEFMSLEWHEDMKEWKHPLQEDVFDKLDEFKEDKFEILWNDVGPKLSDNDSATLLKDMKGILSNLKIMTRSIIKITNDIDKTVSFIRSKHEDSSTYKEIE